jgi:hypothetical protein
MQHVCIESRLFILLFLGTGKSTLLAAVIGATVSEGERVLVCAPSNRAVHSLCRMFTAQHPTVAVALVGTVDSLAAALASAGLSEALDLAFVHGWAARMATRLAASTAALAAEEAQDNASAVAFAGVAHLIRWMLWRAPATLNEVLSEQSPTAVPWDQVVSACDAAAADAATSGALTELRCREVAAWVLAAGQALARRERGDAAWALRNELELLRTASALFCTLTTAGREDLSGGPLHLPVSFLK